MPRSDEELQRIVKSTGRTLYMLDSHLKQCEDALYNLRCYYDEILAKHREARFTLARRQKQLEQANAKVKITVPKLSKADIIELLGEMSADEITELLTE